MNNLYFQETSGLVFQSRKLRDAVPVTDLGNLPLPQRFTPCASKKFGTLFDPAATRFGTEFGPDHLGGLSRRGTSKVNVLLGGEYRGVSGEIPAVGSRPHAVPQC